MKKFLGQRGSAFGCLNVVVLAVLLALGVLWWVGSR